MLKISYIRPSTVQKQRQSPFLFFFSGPFLCCEQLEAEVELNLKETPGQSSLRRLQIVQGQELKGGARGESPLGDTCPGERYVSSLRRSSPRAQRA